MLDLRILGLAFSVLLLFMSVRVYAHGRTRRVDFLIWLAIAFAIGVISAVPSVVSPLLEALNFQRQNNRQIIGLLVLSNLLLFLLYMRASGLASTANRDITRLVRRLAQREYWHSGQGLAHADVIAVIAAYNEEPTIGQVLKNMPKTALGLKVEPLIIVDGGNDRTEHVAREYAVPVVHAINRGQGAALLTGYELAAERGASIIVIMDADGQTMPEELPLLIAPIVNGEADFVNGSRWLGSYERDGRLRPLGVKMFSFLIGLLVRRKVTDAMAAYRAFRASAVHQLNLYEDQFQASELLIEAVRKGMRYKEVPVTIRRREAGKSKKPGIHKYGLGFARAILQAWLR